MASIRSIVPSSNLVPLIPGPNPSPSGPDYYQTSGGAFATYIGFLTRYLSIPTDAVYTSLEEPDDTGSGGAIWHDSTPAFRASGQALKLTTAAPARMVTGGFFCHPKVLSSCRRLGILYYCCRLLIAYADAQSTGQFSFPNCYHILTNWFTKSFCHALDIAVGALTA